MPQFPQQSDHLRQSSPAASIGEPVNGLQIDLLRSRSKSVQLHVGNHPVFQGGHGASPIGRD